MGGSSIQVLHPLSGWQAVIGLEIHAQINSRTKLFSSALCSYDAPPNTMVAPLDYAAPGSMPVLNKRCVEAAVQTAIALNCSIARVSTFDRKHYFYADQPAGYQITQYYHPIAVNGNIEFYVYDYQLRPMPLLKTCRIARLQIEQDTGKTLTDEEGGRVLIDLNRCGVGLMEIVTEHDIQSGLEASCLVKELQALLIAIGSCHGRMERGELRVDANVSVKKRHETELRTRTEDVPKLRSYYAYCVDDCGLDPHGCAEILLNDLPRALKRKRQDLKRCPLNSSDIFALVKARLESTISAESFRKVVRILQDGGDHRSADMLIKDLNLISISDMQTIERTCKEVLAAEQKTLEDYKKGKTIAMKHLLRIASKQLDQRVDMMKLREVFERLINGS